METRRLVLVLTGIAVATVVVIGVLAVALLAGGDGDGGAGSGDNATPRPQESPGVETSPLPERVSGELRLFGPDPITLDPACASDASSAEYIVEIFSGLVTFDKDLILIPDIAEEIPQPVQNADGTVTYAFKIRRGAAGARFHDGRQVTADDFKFSMERSLNPDTQSTVGEIYLDDIVGAREFIDGSADSVTGIEVVDPFTLEITIDRPKSYFLAKLSYPTGFVVDRREVGDATCFEGADWSLNPNGTGPFKLKEWVFSQRIELVPNEDYYLEPKPSLAKVTYVLTGSPLVMYENNEVDLAPVGINDIDRIRDPNEPLHAEFVETDSLDTFYLGFNVREPPFDDPKVRQAMAMAIDKASLTRVVLKDLVITAAGVLPPRMPGFNPDLEGLAFDPGAARDLLDEAGGPDLLQDVVLLTSGRGASVGPILDALIAMWEEHLGVTVQVEQEPFGLFLQDLDEGNFQMFDLGWIADYPDPQNFLDIKFYSRSRNNETGYANPQVDDLLEQARIEDNDDERLRLYQEAERIIVEDAAWIPLYHGKANSLIKPYIKDYNIPPFVIPNLRYVRIAQ